MVVYWNIKRRLIGEQRDDFNQLIDWQRHLLPDYLDWLDDIDHNVDSNAEFLDSLASEAEVFLDLDSSVDDTRLITAADHEKLWSTLRQIVRDWSSAGHAERETCYRPLIDKVLQLTRKRERSQVRILVPGAGLARLVWEVAKLGFVAEGNECSMYMLIVSKFILNNTTRTNQHSVFPYLHNFNNVRHSSDLLQEVLIPDVLPSSLPPTAAMSMSAGDFVEVYSRPDQKQAFDFVLTCFFLDTASNVIDYLSTIRHCLKTGGTWINLGPLLWHHETNSEVGTLALTLEDLLGLCMRMGFAISDERTITCHYTSKPESMLKSRARRAPQVVAAEEGPSSDLIVLPNPRKRSHQNAVLESDQDDDSDIEKTRRKRRRKAVDAKDDSERQPVLPSPEPLQSSERSSKRKRKPRKPKREVVPDRAESSATVVSTPTSPPQTIPDSTDSLENMFDEDPVDEIDAHLLNKPVAKSDKGKAKADGWATGRQEDSKSDKQANAKSADAIINKFEVEFELMRKELAFKDELLNAQKDLIASVQTAVNCQICMDTYNDPLTLECGHTFCRTCLYECFHRAKANPAPARADSEGSDAVPAPSDNAEDENDSPVQAGPITPASEDADSDASSVNEEASAGPPRLPRAGHNNLRCPACRHRVERAPAPVFPIREIAERVRAEESNGGLLYAAATRRSQSREGSLSSPSKAKVDSKKAAPHPSVADKTWGGLFTDAQKRTELRGFRDDDDGVFRCLRCNWEIYDGVCFQCGWSYEAGDESGARPRDLSEDDFGEPVESEEQDEDAEDEDEQDLSDFIVPDHSSSRSQLAKVKRRARRIASESGDEEDGEDANGHHDAEDPIFAEDEDEEDSSDLVETDDLETVRRKRSKYFARVKASPSPEAESSAVEAASHTSDLPIDGSSDEESGDSESYGSDELPLIKQPSRRNRRDSAEMNEYAFHTMARAAGMAEVDEDMAASFRQAVNRMHKRTPEPGSDVEDSDNESSGRFEEMDNEQFEKTADWADSGHEDDDEGSSTRFTDDVDE